MIPDQIHDSIEAAIFAYIQPENTLERALLLHPELQAGLFWGEPRYGHPEGKVLYHIPEVLANIEALDTELTPLMRERLRLIALTHDSFKYREDKSEPRDWSRHHGILAQQFMAAHTDDQAVLEVLATHDEAYYAWRLEAIEHRHQDALRRLEALLHRIGDALQLYYLFFKCDTRTGDKIQAPIKWFEQKVEGIQIIPFKS